jgi:predicted ATPase/DNA-binding winged helix-turn-helix (wHTH) protein
MDRVSETPAAIDFRRFRVLPHRRELLAEGRRVELGGRAFDVLMALIEASGAVVDKNTLMNLVWPDRIVEDNSLQAQISALRKAFAADRDLIRTIAGRGYQFTGEIRMISANPDAQATAGMAQPTSMPSRPPTNLPEPVSELIGRDGEIPEILRLAAAHRLVTLTGAGGIGKTRLAIEIARQLLPRFADGVWLVELAPLSDPDLVPAAVAAAARSELTAGPVSPQRIANALGSKHLMLVLDNCEHVVEAAAPMAEMLLRANPVVRVIATSREPLSAEGEWIYPVLPLTIPTEDSSGTEDPLQYGAVRLFVERARAVEPHFSPDQRNLAAVAAICRHLDGIPLAIELAAARAAALGIEGVAARLNDRFRLLAGGRRTAMPRHQTLRAALDWSYELLTEPDRVVFRRLAIFPGSFALEAASAVATSDEILASKTIDCIADLITKSLITVDPGDATIRYRLLETTRAYALEKLAESGEFHATSRRHAEYYRNLLEAAQDEAATKNWSTVYGPEVDNLRAALGWAFAPGGDASVGVALAAVAEPLWLEMSLVSECQAWAEKAVANLGAAERGTRREMVLQAALGIALMFTHGMTDESHAALTTAVELAERLGARDYQLRILHGLWVYHARIADFPATLALAHRCAAVAPRVSDPVARPMADRNLGLSLHFLGDQAGARAHLARVLEAPALAARHAWAIRFGDHRVNALGILANILWLQGFPDAAVNVARSAVDEARRINHPLSLFVALALGGITTSLRVGDLATADRSIGELIDQAKRHSLAPYHAHGLGAKGMLFARRGDPATAVQLLRTALDGLRKSRYYIFYTMFLGNLAEALGAASHVDEGLAVIDEALGQVERNQEGWCHSEMLRIKGELVLLGGAQNAAAAEAHFRQALDRAGRQQALSWELRAATSLARLWRDQDRRAEGVALLASVYDRFTEGFETADLKAARALIDGSG